MLVLSCTLMLENAVLMPVANLLMPVALEVDPWLRTKPKYSAADLANYAQYIRMQVCAAKLYLPL